MLHGYDKHKICPFQERRSKLIYPKCKEHAHKNCKFQCKDCGILVYSSCIASEQYIGHIFLEVTLAYKKKKDLIENDVKQLINFVFPKHK